MKLVCDTPSTLIYGGFIKALPFLGPVLVAKVEF